MLGAWLATLGGLALEPEAPPAISAPATEGPQVLLGVVPGDATFDRPAFGLVLRDHLADTEATLEVAPTTGATLLSRLEWAKHTGDARSLDAVFWMEPVGDGHRLYLLEPRRQRYWVRALPRAHDAELAFEQVGIMVRSLVSTLDEDVEFEGLSPVAPPPPPEVAVSPQEPTAGSPAAATPRPAAARPLTVAIAYSGSNLDDDTPWQHGIAGALDAEFAVPAFIRFGSAYVPPVTREGALALRLHRLPFRAEAGYRFAERRRIRGEIGAGIVAELLWWDIPTTANVRGLSGTQARVALSVGAGFRVRLVKGWGLHLNTSLDAWLVQLRLVADLPSRATVLRAHPVSGTAWVGTHYTF